MPATTFQRIIIIFFIISLSACGWEITPVAQTPIAWPPSRTPMVLPPSRTIDIITITPTIRTPNESLPTSTDTPPTSPTPYPTSTATSISPLSVDILGCNTSLDITHGMGEVTNAYTSIINQSETSYTNVCATLTASDEARQHPDKTQCIASLPAHTQVMFKLTVDTGFRVDTAIQIDITTNEGRTAFVMKESCQQIGLFKFNPGSLGTVVPIATFAFSP